ncbi:tetratricopeptide repeat-containing sensor histidine kinase [Kriegella aquimaris]|uniref:histidine kinase n=1 Tax=Kriegella aquimaris TaxID=192904 RepID=A0A1G9NM29_9FLAO|nr:histidine kinase dimerization/phosphoacceptor domain -containing protein [Kriegella aquimaris]SDL87035.1 Two-component sensor histidine kinase, contains HisKA and HATPase domains [Kriegella aquimaris]
MKKSLCKIYYTITFIVLTIGTLVAQEAGDDKGNILETFVNKETPNEKFLFFFDTPNRYRENSAYDWLDKVNKYLISARQAEDSVALKRYLLVQAQIYFDLGDYKRSLAISKELYQDKENLEEPLMSALLNLKDMNFSQLELYDEQIEVRKEKRELGITENTAFYDIYSNLGLHNRAMKEYIEKVKKTIDEKDYYAIAEFNNNIGNYLRLDKSTPTALSKYKEARGFVDVFMNDITKEKTERNIVEGNILKGKIEGNIGKCYVQLKQYEEAIPFLDSSITRMKEFSKGMFSSELVENTLEIAECYLFLNDFEKATDYLSNDPRPVTIANVLKKNRLMALYYEKTQDYQNAATYYKNYIKVRDSISVNDSEIKKQQLATVMSEELADTRRMLDEQREDLEESKNQNIEKDERINLVFISLIFTLLGFAGLVYAYLKSIKNQRLIAEQKYIIENSLVEKDSLLKEIHHRVKNNLQMVSSLLSLQTKNTRSKAAIEALEEGKSRVKAMALIHQKLYQNDDLSVIEMQGYIESLINSVQSVYKKGGHNINVTIDAEGVELDIDRAIPFGLMLNELVSNSFKYAFPNDEDNGNIYIHIRKNVGQDGYFEYSDNGIGLPEDSEEKANSSMGIRLMNRLANQLQTTLNNDKNVQGVRFWFNFK